MANQKYYFGKDAPDANTKLLLRNNDGEDASTNFVDLSANHHIITPNGNVQLDDTYKKFQLPMIKFDGTGDLLQAPDHADWNFGTGDFTCFDGYIMFGDITGAQCLVGQYEDGENFWHVIKDAAHKIEVIFEIGNVVKISYIMSAAWASLTAFTLYHVRVVRTTTSVKVFIDGVSQTLTETTAASTNDVGDVTDTLNIGEENGGSYFNGWMAQDLRVTKAEARSSANFTKPALQYFLYNLNSNSAEIEDFKPGTSSRIQQSLIPRNEGAIIQEARLKPAQLEIVGSIIGTTQANLRTNRDTFSQRVIGAKKDRLYLWDDRYLPNAQVQRYAYSYEKGMLMLRFKVTFVGDKPFFIAVADSSDSEIIAATPTSYLVTTAGNAFVQPIITIDATEGGAVSTGMILENITNSQKFVFNAELADTKKLIIDTAKFTVKNDGTLDLDSFSGDFMRLEPGVNVLKWTGSDCTVKFDWQDRWWV